MSDEQVFEFLVAAGDDVPPSDDMSDEFEAHFSFPLRRKGKVEVTSAQLGDFWRDKVVGLTNTVSEAQQKNETKGFAVDEISFSLGVGAKGGIFFVAEASVDASITVTLRRRDADSEGA